MLAAAAAGCASTTGPRLAATPQQPAPAQASNLDRLASANKPAAPTAATARATAPVAVSAAAAPVHPLDREPPYTLDTGDRIRVVVFGQDGLTNSYLVDAGGAITMPLIKAVMARGLTTDALAREVTGRLRGGFVREPHVAIEVEVYRPFFILGEVTTPGQYAYVPRMTVENAVAIAGGFTPRADRWDIRIDRPVAGGVLRQSVPLVARVRPGDTITVTERWF
jgi:polysaccharide biosynthesis/export protein